MIIRVSTDRWAALGPARMAGICVVSSECGTSAYTQTLRDVLRHTRRGLAARIAPLPNERASRLRLARDFRQHYLGLRSFAADIATVENGILAPSRHAYKGLLVFYNQAKLTVEVAKQVKEVH
ncbi:hypothetical protein F5Y05DRAFT_382629 [Hypoxylon sp. FL0543]|nr:hypothetical protein F5Y05DRAFT_382629 [Hypoxylon sp. FL0543]